MWDDYPAAYAEGCPRCGGTIAPGASFCAECGASRPPRVTLPPPSQKRRPWVVFGIVTGGLAAVVAGAFIAVALTGPRDVGLVAPSPSDTPSASVTPSASASNSVTPSSEPTPTATAVPTPQPNAQLPNRSIADVQVDQLNLRAAGNESADILGQLRAGARVFTIGAPEAVGGTYWYRVAVAAGPYSGGEECYGDPYCEADIGWVASPVTGDPWLEAVDIGCPSSPMTADELSSLTPLERLHCYGGEDITVTGTLDQPCCGHVGPVRYEPPWLALPGGQSYFHGSGLPVRLSPDAGLEIPERGDMVEASAHLDDPAAASCRQSVDPEYEAEDIGLSSPAWVVLNCRTQLVVTGYEVVGTEDLGPCCGSDPAERPVGRIAERWLS